MLRPLSFLLCVLVTGSVLAQAPSRNPSEAVQKAQIRASAAYRELTESEYQLKLAEQDYVNTQDAYQAAAKSAEDIKRELDKTKNAFDAAKAREARARKAYEAALDAVERAWGKPPKNR